jgi:hypothetical protein
VTTNDLADPIEAIPVETTTANPLTTAVAWIAVVAAVAFIGFWVWTRWIDPPVGGTIDRYVNHNAGAVFADPNVAQFRVTMPTRFQVSSLPNELGTIVTVSDNPGGGYQFSVTKTPEPASALDSYEQGLNRRVGQIVSDAGAELVKQTKPIPFGDIVYKMFVYRKGGTYWRGELQLLKDRLYTIIVKAPNDDPKPEHHLLETFQILGPR